MTLESLPHRAISPNNLDNIAHGHEVWQQLFAHSVDATLVWQGGGHPSPWETHPIACNQAAAQLFGYDEADVLQLSHRQLSHRRHTDTPGQSTHPMLGATLPEPGCYRFEWCYTTANQHPFLAEVTLWAIARPSQPMVFYEVCRPLGGCPGSPVVDNSAAQLLQRVLDTIPMAIFWKDRQSVYLGCNHIFAEAAGLSHPSQIIGLTDFELPWAPAEAEIYRQNDQQVMASQLAEYHILEPQQRADGSHIWCDANKIPLCDEEGRVVGVLGTFEDVTQRKAYEDELQQKAQCLEAFVRELQKQQSQLIQTEKMSSLGQLVAGVAHEINNPVNFIHGNLTHARSYIEDVLSIVHAFQDFYPHPSEAIEELIEEVDLDFLVDDLPRVLESMQMGTHRIREIIASLRTFSRLDEAEVKAVDIHSGIDSTLLILQGRLKATSKRPAIQVHKAYASLPDVECFAGQLNQVFMNILSNAIDALDEQAHQRTFEDNTQNPGQIWISTQEMGDRPTVQVSIRDNGPGIPDSIRQRIFDPFFTTKPVGKGTGLGMSISYQIIVDRHGGQITCQSAAENGTEFCLEIPVQALSLIDMTD
jgi:PAS domain S-box-containing protein